LILKSKYYQYYKAQILKRDFGFGLISFKEATPILKGSEELGLNHYCATNLLLPIVGAVIKSP
jgi:hypothetical protein